MKSIKIQILNLEETMNDNRKIGIIDSGVGGLTVAKEFRNLLPQENILYLGDNKNVPYGNKTEEEIYLLTKDMVNFLLESDVKLIAVACNTISSILDKYFLDIEVPIVSIISPATDYVINKKLNKVGIMATQFTINSGTYKKYLNKRDKDLLVISEPFTNLAEMVDKGDYTEKEIMNEIEKHMNIMLQKEQVKDIILGCTHYPIVLDKFKQVAPNINFINPAYEQTRYVKNIMKEMDIRSNEKESIFEIYTTGNKDVYLKLMGRLFMEVPNNIYEVENF